MPKVKIKMSKWTLFGHISCQVELEGNIEELVWLKERGFDSIKVS